MTTALITIVIINIIFAGYIYIRMIRQKNKRIKDLEEYEYRWRNKYTDENELS